MRMRKKKNGEARIAACSDLLITDVERLKIEPLYAFEEKKPLYIEIGCGKGNFACGIAAANPHANFIAMEKVTDVACLALEKAKSRAEERCDNLRFLIGDAKNLSLWFPESCADRIYLNFSDPWPKSGHAKRRLTYRSFLELYRKILKEGGELILKTDNMGLFDFSLEEFNACGLELVWSTRDLHNSKYCEGNVMTEYEANFSSQGMPIYSAKVVFHKKRSLIKDLMRVERSYRSFDNKVKIDRDTLESFVDNARLCPSSVNIQPLKYRLCCNDKERLMMLTLTKWAGLLKNTQLPPYGHAPTAYIVICIDKNVSDKNIFEKDVGIAAQTIMLSAVEAGFGGCMIGNFNSDDVSEALKLPDGIVPALILGLGKPDEKVMVEQVGEQGTAYYRDSMGVHRVPKRSLEEIII